MEKINLQGVEREIPGKTVSKQLRKDGRIPAIVYGKGKKGLNISVIGRELWRAIHTSAGGNAIITMNITGGKKASEKTVIVREVQLHPMDESFVHVDFQEISLTEKLKVKVPVSAKGEAIGVKEQKGVLAQVLWEIEVECLPTQIPGHIDVLVDNLHIGEAIHIKDIVPPEGVTFVGDMDQVVVTVSHQQAEEVVAEAAAPVEGEAEPELIKKGKKEEEGEEAEAVAEAPKAASKEKEKKA